jgi:hypothetical protein
MISRCLSRAIMCKSGWMEMLSVETVARDGNVKFSCWIFNRHSSSTLQSFFVIYFMILSAFRPYSTKWKDEWWTGRKWSWLNTGIVMESAWRDCGKSRKIRVRIASVSDKTETGHLPHTSPQQYWHTNLLGNLQSRESNLHSTHFFQMEVKGKLLHPLADFIYTCHYINFILQISMSSK